jgi:hypothetical protein
MTAPVLPAISHQSVMDATRVRTFRDRYADALANAGFDMVEQVARLDRASFKNRSNLRPKTLRELAGRPKERLTAADVTAGALYLSLPPDDARETVADAVPKRLPAVRVQIGAGSVMSNPMMVTQRISRAGTTPAPASGSAKPAGCMSCSARRLPSPQRLSHDRAGSNWPAGPHKWTYQSSTAVHLQESAKLVCLPIGGPAVLITENGLSRLQQREPSRQVAGNTAQPGAGTPGQAGQAKE